MSESVRIEVTDRSLGALKLIIATLESAYDVSDDSIVMDAESIEEGKYKAGTSLKAAGFRVVADIPAREQWTPAEGVNRAQHNLFGEVRRPPEAKVRWQRTLA